MLDTLQHGLPGDAEGGGGDLHGDPAGGRVVGDEDADGIGESASAAHCPIAANDLQPAITAAIPTASSPASA